MNGLPSVPPKFKPLIDVLQALRDAGYPQPLRSVVGCKLVEADRQVYEKAGASKFADFSASAATSGLIVLGGTGGKAWIRLHPSLNG